jgi:hypothetical protein
MKGIKSSIGIIIETPPGGMLGTIHHLTVNDHREMERYNCR